MEGTIWDDGLANSADGERKPDELLYDGVIVELYKVGEDTPCGTTTTDENGHYRFENLDAGEYVVVIQKGDILTDKDVTGVDYTVNSNGVHEDGTTVIRESEPLGEFADRIYLPTDEEIDRNPSQYPTVDNNYNLPDLDAGYVDYTRSLEGTIWDDGPKNRADGERKPEEELYENVVVNLYKADDLTTIVDSTVTNAEGHYKFENLEAGNYVVVIEKNDLELTSKDVIDVPYTVNSNAELVDDKVTILESEVDGSIVNHIYLPTDEELADGTTYQADENSNYNIPDLDAGYVDGSLYNLSVSKTVTGNLGNRAKKFEFTLHLEGNNVPESLNFELEGTTGTKNIDNGDITFELSHGETIVFKDIPEGISYVVTEEEVKDYVVTKTNDTGVMNDDIAVSFENNRDGGVPTASDTPSRMNMRLLIWFGLACLGMLLYLCRKRRFDK